MTPKRREPEATTRSFDTGRRVTVRYAPATQVRMVSRAASTPPPAPLPPGLTSFSAYVREIVATGASVAPYWVESFCAETVPPTEAPSMGIPAEPAMPAPGPTPITGPAQPGPSALVPEPVPATPEERMRAQWALEEQVAGTRALSEATPNERQAVNAIRCAAGQPDLMRTAPADIPTASPRPVPSAPAPATAPAPPDGHARFDDLMAAELAYATTYDAGNVTLARRFRELDALLDREQGLASRPSLSQAAHGGQPHPAVDDQALLADIEALCERLGPSAPESPQPPVNEPAPAPQAAAPAAPAPAAAPPISEHDHAEITS